MSTILHVHMTERSVQQLDVDSRLEKHGGRSFIARYLLDHIDPRCNALGPKNILILAPGLLAGLPLSSTGRLSIGAKSPLTGGIKEANVGGTPGDKLGRLGIKAIVVSGKAPEGIYILHLSKDGAELVDSGEMAKLGTYETTARLLEKYGGHCGVLVIGPAGEMGLRGAGISATEDLENVPGRMAARGGLGAVMGSKGLKAVVVDDAGTSAPAVCDEELFRQASRRFAKELIESPKTGKEGSMHRFGTVAIMGPVNDIGALPTRNFSRGQFEGVANINAEKLRETILERGGKIGQRCMPGCVIQCSNIYVDEQGVPIVSTLQYETLALMGSNLEIDNLDEIAMLNRMCNDFGVDSIEMGAALGVAMEAGLAEFGDGEGARKLLEEIGKGSVLGRMLGNGAETTGRILGMERTPVARGQAFPGYDPRALKGNGVTYATSAMGADHTAGNAIGTRNTKDPLDPEGTGDLSRGLQRVAAMLDMTGLCLFARPPIVADPDLMVQLLNGRYGWGWTVEDLVEAEDELLRMEREFNVMAGFTPAHDRLPEIFYREPLPPTEGVFDVTDEEMASTLKDL
ncbi:MAG: aldehyde ferredoxin oxidoreductase [Anaerolineales bacterium]|nr:aldehyde ferredoxin oxidoreductase [Anaerolineales bacterium]